MIPTRPKIKTGYFYVLGVRIFIITELLWKRLKEFSNPIDLSYRRPQKKMFKWFNINILIVFK